MAYLKAPKIRGNAWGDAMPVLRSLALHRPKNGGRILLQRRTGRG